MINNIKQIRLSLGMSRKDFAKYLHVTYGAVCNYEYGTRHPRPHVWDRIFELTRRKKIKLGIEDIYPRFE